MKDAVENARFLRVLREFYDNCTDKGSVWVTLKQGIYGSIHLLYADFVVLSANKYCVVIIYVQCLERTLLVLQLKYV